MYYLGKSGKVFTEEDIRNSFEIIYGISPNESEMFDSFHAAVSIYYMNDAVQEGRKETIDFLVSHGCRTYAITEHRKLYGCSLRESVYTIEKLMEENKNVKSD